jgi:inner membrane protein
LCNYWYKQQYLSAWIGLWFWSLITHPLLDVFTVYGTQLLAPFSDHRFSFCAVPIVDPFYSVPLLISIIAGWFMKKHLAASQIISAITLLLTTAYLFLGIEVRDRALQHVKSKNPIIRSEAFTAMFNIFYRRIVIEEPNQYRVGFVNMLHPEPIKWHTFKKSEVSDAVLAKREVRIFYWFADDWVLPVHEGNSSVLYDMRFGATDQNLKGYWGIKINNEHVTWERFVSNLNFTSIKNLWNAAR